MIPNRKMKAVVCTTYGSPDVLQLGEVDKPIPKENEVLVNVHASTVTAAVQLAKHFGAEVTGVCSTANLKLVQSLGADQVIDYTKMDFTRAGQTYDIIFDTIGKSSFSRSKSALKPTGLYLSPVLGLSLLLQMMQTSIIGTKKAKFSATGLMPVPELRKMLDELIEIIETGQIQTVIDRRYTLEQAAEAHRYVDTGRKKGNVVLTVLA